MTILTTEQKPLREININFSNESYNYKLEPKTDISPLECIHLNMLMTCCSVPGLYHDWDFIIKDYKLERHFRITLR